MEYRFRTIKLGGVIEMKRFMYMVLAIIIISLGVSFMRLSNLGTDPFNCMNLGVSSHLPISYGTYQMLFNIVLFIPLVKLKPSIWGAGAIANMFLSAYCVDGFMAILRYAGITIDAIGSYFWIRVFILLLGIIFMCLGAALYIECDMGIAAYDALGQIIEEKTDGKLKYKMIRIITDCSCIMIGFLTGSVVSVGTIIGAFFTGPLISRIRYVIVEKGLLDDKTTKDYILIKRKDVLF